MESNETVADIVEEMVEFGNHCAAFGGAYSPERWNNLCKRLIAAHKRAIAAKDAEIAKLRERIKVAEDALEKCVNYNNSWELEAAKENAKNALAVIRGKGGEMSLDVAIQTFQSQKDSVLWRSLDDNGIVKYYYAEDCVYVLKFGMTYAFVKAKSPRLAWRKFCKES